MTALSISEHLRMLLSYWGANAYYPEDAPRYIRSLNAQERKILKNELQLLSQSSGPAQILSRATTFEIDSNATAMDFLVRVNSYLFLMEKYWKFSDSI